MAKQALGKGLGALIGRAAPRNNPPTQSDEADVTVPASPKVESPTASAGEDKSGQETVLRAALDQIVPSPLQPRKTIRQEQLEELMASIREHGVMQPLIVRRMGGKLELIAGERRWRASTAIGLPSVPVIIREASDKDVLELALIENLQREDLNPIEEAQAYVRLAREFEMKQEDIAKRVGKNRATVANAMRLLDLAGPLQEQLAQGRLSTGHAKVLLGVKDPNEQILLADMVMKGGLTVRATEKLVSGHLNPDKDKGKTSGKSAGSSASDPLSTALRDVQNRLREHFSTQVNIAHGPKKGKIEIEYYGNDDLERLLEILGVSE
jgi:ParB family chromosome partitioning protein